jgi:hypothetical protein
MKAGPFFEMRDRGSEPSAGRLGSYTRRTDFNTRLTSLAGMTLFVLLAAQGVTILRIHRLLTLHYVLGFLLLGPVVLKVGTTGYRFARYYTGDPEYRRAGPPRPLLRVLAPLLVVSTLAVFGTGVALAFASPTHGSLLVRVHKVSFIVWFGCTTVHVLAYLRRAASHAADDLVGRGVELRSRRSRLLLVGVSLLMGCILALPAVGWAHTWLAHKTHVSGP